MFLASLGANRPRRPVQKCAVIFLAVAAIGLSAQIAGPRVLRPSYVTEQSCSGLHAGIRAQLVRDDPNGSRPAFVNVSLILLNDGQSPINSTAGGWQIVIDGKELSDSSYLVGNGMQPEGGYNTLNPGEWYELGKKLEISKYFHGLGQHTVSWKGQQFQSSTITVNITPL
jgi:hypothetical protein